MTTPTAVPKRLGDMLVREGIVSARDMERAKEYADQNRTNLISGLIAIGAADETHMQRLVSSHFSIPSVIIHNHTLDSRIVQHIPRDKAERYGCIAMSKNGRKLVVAMSDPSDLTACDELRSITGGMEIEVVFANVSSIRTAIAQYYPPELPTIENIEKEAWVPPDDTPQPKSSVDISQVETGDSPGEKFLKTTLRTCIERGASDIHIEPGKTTTVMRMRIDGVLQRITERPSTDHPVMVSIIKIWSNLDIAEKRRPQDGRMPVRHMGREIGFRVSTVPATYGEKVVLRLLDSTNLARNLRDIGLSDKESGLLNTMIHRPYGLVLITGPTGSGKTTTLYSILAELNKPGVNICTVENPVEYTLAGTTQVQVQEEIDLTFATALRSFLRQDPDIILVGEIRDFETAEVALKAAQTGHMVFSTLHTNDAASAVSRLVNMGIEPYTVAQTTTGVVAQRLMRKICPHCKAKETLSQEVLGQLGITKTDTDINTYRSTGCAKCNHTGYKGRVAIYEILPCTEKIQQIIVDGATAQDIKAAARISGMRTLRESAIEKMLNGITTKEEVERCTTPD